ncbi:uncharacterized peptidase C1-like protein F26E4.3 isoform X2 [Neocloeon triangulifer]|nr:uncharacterized peptidase C1-like protein F26E4.3 isoform X2 [Neocloeon triangulifer]
MSGVRWHSLWVGCLLVCAAVLAYQGDISDLPPGPYCGQRTVGCCNGRADSCSAPILGTLCYCDDFCNRTLTSDDCCPDYWSFCHGIQSSPEEPTKVCVFNGILLAPRDSAKDNCKTCTCMQTLSGPNKVEMQCEQVECLVEPDTIDRVNGQRGLTWSAANYSSFWGRALHEGKQYKLGTLEPRRTVRGLIPVKRVYDAKRLPHSFDARTKWQEEVSGVVDQGWCASSWALSTIQVAADRLGIMSLGREIVELSAQQLLECNTRGQQGCKGGHLDRAWMHIRKYGVVEERCYPYIGDHNNPGKCKIGKTIRSLGAARCLPQHQIEPPRTETYRTGPAYRIKSEQDIMHEIFESGPVQATMAVHHEFFMYQRGVYQASRPNLKIEGYHSVRIIGWGEEPSYNGPPVKYWLAMNSWGTEWGEDGLFRIRRGTNECEIEDFVLAAWAQTTSMFTPNTFPPLRRRRNKFTQKRSAHHRRPLIKN